MKKTYCIYVAGKLTAETEEYIQCLHRMCRWANVLRRQGFSVFVPGTDFLLGFLAGDCSRIDLYNNSQPWLLRADAIFLVPDWESSKGTNEEIELAKQHSIPVFTNIWELLRWAKVR